MYTNINSPKSMVNNISFSQKSSFARIIEVPDHLPTHSIDGELLEIENYRKNVISGLELSSKKKKNPIGKLLFLAGVVATCLLVKMKIK